MIDLSEVKKIEAKAKCLIPREKIDLAISQLAHTINHSELADQTPLFLCVMNGALIFMGQLITQLTFPLQLDYIQVSRYHGTERRDLKWIAEPSISLTDRNVVIIEDVLDSGLTLAAINKYCDSIRRDSIDLT